MSHDFQTDIDAVHAVAAVPTILDIVCRLTGMGFAAVARVTEDRWIACKVLDNVDFGLPDGGELKVETTLCHEIRQHREVVAIDNVADDPVYAQHHTPKLYGLQSYISVPILLPDGRFFGTLCAISAAPASVKSPEIIGTFKVFAELIAYHLDANEKLAAAQANLFDQRASSDLREQFIAVLGHDLRNPLASLQGGTNILLREPQSERSTKTIHLMRAAVTRMSGLIDNVMDFARGRLGGGLSLNRVADQPLAQTLEQVIAEIRSGHPEVEISAEIPADIVANVDHGRIAQMFSNLLGNAVTHGADHEPVRVKLSTTDTCLLLAVANSGPPIPPAAIPRLFQPFQRGEFGSSEGLGLGLYISSQIAEAHGGHLEVTSDAEETCFTFHMPLS
jgi:signal transduction histidine kinase